MTTSAFVLPYDHQTTGAIVDGVDAAKLWSTTPQGEKPPKVGTIRTFYNTPPSKLTTVSSLGDGFATKKVDEKRELIRKSVASAVKDLKELEGVKDVAIDASADPHAAGMLTSTSHRGYFAEFFANSCCSPFGLVHVYVEDFASFCIQSQSEGTHPCETLFHTTPGVGGVGQGCHLC